jgi:ferric-chelate reductase
MTMSITGSAPSSTTSSSDALSTAGMDMTNATQQMDFLMQILDDTELQVISNSYARRYWYGVVVIIALAALSNTVMRVASHSRWVLQIPAQL